MNTEETKKDKNRRVTYVQGETEWESDFGVVAFNYGQQGILLDRICRKTGLRDCGETDPQYERFMDGGSIDLIQLLGGEFDGATIKWCGHDEWQTDELREYMENDENEFTGDSEEWF